MEYSQRKVLTYCFVDDQKVSIAMIDAVARRGKQFRLKDKPINTHPR